MEQTDDENIFYSFPDWKGDKIVQIDYIKVLPHNIFTIDDVCNFIDKKEFEKLMAYEVAFNGTLDYIRMALIKDNKDMCFLSVLIDPVELFDDMYVKKITTIDAHIYDFLLKNKQIEEAD